MKAVGSEYFYSIFILSATYPSLLDGPITRSQSLLLSSDPSCATVEPIAVKRTRLNEGWSEHCVDEHDIIHPCRIPL
jgi:hypothetical protein